MKAIKKYNVYLLLLLMLACPNLQAQRLLIVVYYANWTDFPFNAIPVKNIDVINYAFLRPNPDGTLSLSNKNYDIENFKKIVTLKKINPKLKVLLSIGGWTFSTNFSKIAADETLTNNFISDIVKLLHDYPDVDGVDIDWEYPVTGGDNILHSDNDKMNYVNLVTKIRNKLNQLSGKHYYLTIATPHHNRQKDGGSVKNFDIVALLKSIDWVNVMTYEVNTPVSSPNITNNAAPLYDRSKNILDYHNEFSVDEAIKDYLQQGLTTRDKTRLILGIPIYGYAWKGVSNVAINSQNPGLFAAARGAYVNKLFDTPNGRGDFSYAVILQQLIPSNSLIRSWNDTDKYATYYNPKQKLFLSFDDIQTLQEKVNYVKKMGLGGVMFWEISFDTYDQDSLVYHTCLQLRTGKDQCSIPKQVQKEAHIVLELTNNDPEAAVDINLIDENGKIYKFPTLNKKGQIGSNQVFTDTNNTNIKSLLNSKKIHIQLTSDKETVTCNKTLNLTQSSNSYHHLQVFYSYPIADCLVE